MASWEFPGADPIDLDINLPSGSIAITAEPTEATTVSLMASRPGRGAEEAIAQIRVEYRDGRLEIFGPKQGLRRGGHALDLTVKVPAGSRCAVRTASADVACVGELASLDARTASGDVTAALVSGPARVVTASGDVWLEEVTGEVAANTASGDLRLLRAGADVNATTASGNVRIGSCSGSANARTVSGDVRIASIARGRTDLNCVSGDVTIGVVPGASVYLDIFSLSGRVSSELGPADGEGEAELHVKCRSISGDVQVTRAVPAQAG
jgi:Putative adhesin